MSCLNIKILGQHRRYAACACIRQGGEDRFVFSGAHHMDTMVVSVYAARAIGTDLKALTIDDPGQWC